MKRTTGILLILLGVGLGIWGFVRRDREPDVKIGDLEIGVHKDYPVTVLVVAGVAIIAGVVTVSGRKSA